MKEITTRFSDLILQNVRCTGTIKNTSKGLEIELVTKDHLTKEDFLISFLNNFHESYGLFAGRYNQKEYKRSLKAKIETTKKELELLEFAHKICGRKIIED